MKTIILAAGAAALALSAGSAVAGPKNRTAAAAGPQQPIPYSQLDAYSKASPSQRASRDWSSSAAGAAGVNASATTSASSPPTDAANAAGAPTAPMGDPMGETSLSPAEANSSGSTNSTGSTGGQAPTTVNPSMPSSGANTSAGVNAPTTTPR